MDQLNAIIDWLLSSHVVGVFQAIALLVIGYLVARISSAGLVKLLQTSISVHLQIMMKRGIFYLIFVLFIMSALRELGFDLSVLLGAAGILTVAIGFASQTSASNLISGLFLMIERPFSVKDVIRVGTTTGEVISIDLLSVKLRTMDNLFVRIPNETMIKTEVTTLTKFPIRRMDILVGVAYKEDIDQVKNVLLDIAEKNALCLEEPAPLIIMLGFGASSVDLQFSVWATRENFLQVKNAMYTDIKATFDELGIEIPFPHVSLYSGSSTDPMPVNVVTQNPPPSLKGDQSPNEK